jgi:urease accessory protein
MNSVDLALWNKLQSTKPASSRWQADLSLGFESRQGRSMLARRQHNGPLVIQKTLHPEGDAVCHGVIVHPPGGIAGGDHITLKANLGQSANALLTTPGATKWYKANGNAAHQYLDFTLDDAACLEWLPQENILFDGSQIALSADIQLAEASVYVGWEILCFGRQAQQEHWQTGRYQQSLRIWRDQSLIWRECALLNAQQRLFDSVVGLRGNVVTGGFVVAAGRVPDDILAACREVKLTGPAKFGVTALPQIFSARYVGMSAPQAREYFEQLWHILRPWYAGREVTRPRIWKT